MIPRRNGVLAFYQGTLTKRLPDSVSDIWVARDRYSGPVNCRPTHNPGAGVPDPGHPGPLQGRRRRIQIRRKIRQPKAFRMETIPCPRLDGSIRRQIRLGEDFEASRVQG